MKIKNKEVRGLCKSFVYAFRGLWYCIKNERNMRIHITAAALVLPFSVIYNLTRDQYALLLLMIGLVMVCELVNTAIEALVNLGSPAYDSLARIAKDVAAGAVLMCAIGAVAVAVALFGDPLRLLAAVVQIATHPLYILLFLILIVAGVLFIFRGVGKPRVLRSTTSKKEEVKVYKPSRHLITQYDENAEVKIYDPHKHSKE